MTYLSDMERDSMTFWGQKVNAQVRGFSQDPSNDILVMNVCQSDGETWIEQEIPFVDAIRISELVLEWYERHQRLAQDIQSMPGNVTAMRSAQQRRFDEIRAKIAKANHEGNESLEGYLRSHIPPCEVCSGDHPTYFCCDSCNHDSHRCHFCGDFLGHAGKGHCTPEDNQSA